MCLLAALMAAATVHAANYTVRAGQSLVVNSGTTLSADVFYLGNPGSQYSPSDGACGATLTVGDGATLDLATQFMSAGENVTLVVSNGTIHVTGQYSFYFGYTGGEYTTHHVTNNTAVFIGERARIRSDSSQSQIKFTADSRVVFDLSEGAYEEAPLIGKYIEINADATVEIAGIDALARTLEEDAEVPLVHSEDGRCYITPAAYAALEASLPAGCRLMRTDGVNPYYISDLRLFVPARAPATVTIDGAEYTFERVFRAGGYVFLCSEELPGSFSRDEAEDFLDELNGRNHLALRLPTKAEWETAAGSDGAARHFANLFDGRREWCSDGIGADCGVLKGGSDEDWPEYRNAGFNFYYHPSCRDDMHGIRPAFPPAAPVRLMKLGASLQSPESPAPTTPISTAWINQACDIATIEFTAGQMTPYFINQGGSTTFTLSGDASLGSDAMYYIYTQAMPVGAVHSAEVVFDFAAGGNHTLRIPCGEYFQTSSATYSTLDDPFAHEYRFRYIGGTWDICGGELSFGYSYTNYPGMHTVIDATVFTNMQSCVLSRRNRRGLLELENGAAIYSDGNIYAFETRCPNETGNVVRVTGGSRLRAEGYFYIGFPGDKTNASRPCGANRLEILGGTVDAGVQVMMTGSDFTTVLSNGLIHAGRRYSFYYGYEQGEFVRHEVARNTFTFAGLRPRIRSDVPELAQMQFRNTRVIFDLADGPYLEAPVIGAKTEVFDSCEVEFTGLGELRRKIGTTRDIDLIVSLTGESVFSDTLVARTNAALPDWCRVIKDGRNRIFLRVSPESGRGEAEAARATYYAVNPADGAIERFDSVPAGGWGEEFRRGGKLLFRDLGGYAMGVYEVCGTDGRPTTGISYEEAEKFAAELGAQLGLPFALPSEEQWLRANPETGDEAEFFHFYNGGSNGVAAVVGSFAPNSLGIYDMKGNAAEWCLGAALKGGSFVHHAAGCGNSAVRYIEKTDYRDITTGLRLVLNLDGAAERSAASGHRIYPLPADEREYRVFDLTTERGEYIDPAAEVEMWDETANAARMLFRRIGGKNAADRFYLAVFETSRETGYSRDEAEEFLADLNSTFTYGRFALPSEAEWERGAREEAAADGEGESRGPRLVNLFGGKREWCGDEIGADCGVLRGGSDEDWPEYRTPEYRFFAHPESVDCANGFRIKWTPPNSEPRIPQPLTILFN